MDSEGVVAIIPNATLKSGFLGLASKPYILVLTQRRVIFVHITSVMMKQLVNDARDDAKSEGKGFFGQWGAQLGAYSKFAQRYMEMSPEDALAESPENFAVERADIKKSKLKAGSMNEDGATSPDRLVIKSAQRTYDLMLGSGSSQARQALIAAEMI